jgi:hypothetical protein
LFLRIADMPGQSGDARLMPGWKERSTNRFPLANRGTGNRKVSKSKPVPQGDFHAHTILTAATLVLFSSAVMAQSTDTKSPAATGPAAQSDSMPKGDMSKDKMSKKKMTKSKSTKMKKMDDKM